MLHMQTSTVIRGNGKSQVPRAVCSLVVFGVLVCMSGSGCYRSRIEAAAIRTGDEGGAGTGIGRDDGSTRSSDGSAGRGAIGTGTIDPKMLPAKAQGACAQVADVMRKEALEQKAQSAAESGPPRFGADGFPVMSDLLAAPCGECMAKCSVNSLDRCSNQDACIERHCGCYDGCVDLPTGDFCGCAATCTGLGDPCLSPWLDYAQCISKACSATCR